ncbi:Crp/Fnr family transcriptional regulator [Algoriphagus sp. D3-2-R+10]|uniref:Crp/Fnr family transcriptional regulator n=1 Tax=Algoriphagus aurantiacus TaxID=3103948 RepID=UPI002B3EFD88|nr:Crp/Fnr family transcriptional regulator [Algoriphagus sp. D3-2-R+10]MEB2778680.1 Crp/Fnr family transcriptional regulator [Algoriphagus sp. D3-2-R+10]
MEDHFKAILGSITSFSETEWNEIRSCFSVKNISSKNLVTKIGDVEKNIYFIINGVLRLFCLNPKNEEVTIFLFKENHFASCFQSFLTQSESDQALESITDCTLLVIDKKKLEGLYESIPQMNLVTRVISEQRFVNAQRIFTSQIMYTPEQRYLRFEKEHGDLLLRVPHHIISSFLGITPVSMSRIRRRIIQK